MHDDSPRDGRADAPAAADLSDPARSAPTRTLVWDAPVRVFHWLLVLCFAGAWLTAEGERWQLVHVTLGYTMAGLVAFRILWGLVGTRHARFASFVRGPQAVLAYLRSLLQGRPQRHAGHNPAGALAIVALLVLAVGVTFSGWAALDGAHWLKELHEGVASVMLALAGLHVVAVVASSVLHRENLVRSMFTGRKEAPPAEGIRRPWRALAALLLAGVVGFWWLQWSAPAGDLVAGATHGRLATMAHHGHTEQDEDDD